jgi:hypothetical protein
MADQQISSSGAQPNYQRTVTNDDDNTVNADQLLEELKSMGKEHQKERLEDHKNQMLRSNIREAALYIVVGIFFWFVIRGGH